VAVKMLQELWQSPLNVSHDSVDVIGHGAEGVKLRAGALGGDGQAVGDNSIRLP
jgi:hypothetical protein